MREKKEKQSVEHGIAELQVQREISSAKMLETQEMLVSMRAEVQALAKLQEEVSQLRRGNGRKKGKKPRCFSADKMAYKSQKRASRWSGMGATKQQQVRLDAKRELEQKQHAVAAAQRQVAAQGSSSS